ncbi:MAG TPA: VC0807 family protein [Thermomicrobiales bacterium]|nr:VC0807 family protein [Thermomicrobiales bacterium]
MQLPDAAAKVTSVEMWMRLCRTTAGISLYVALIASAVASSIGTVVSLLRGSAGHVSLWTVLSLAALALSFSAGSERFLLATESLLTVTVGAWFLLSTRAERPLAYQFARPLLEGRRRFSSRPWNQLWEESLGFRRIWRVSSVMWGIATLIDAVLRVAIAYTLPVRAVPALSTAMFIATWLVMQVLTNVYYARAGLRPMLKSGAVTQGNALVQRSSREDRNVPPGQGSGSTDNRPGA